MHVGFCNTKFILYLKSRDKIFYYKKFFPLFQKTDTAGSRESKKFFCPALCKRSKEVCYIILMIVKQIYIYNTNLLINTLFK
jgi:hypothetical protein